MIATAKGFLLVAIIFSGLIVGGGCSSQGNHSASTRGLSFDGTVQAVDLKNQSLTLMPLKPGKPVVFAWDKSTKFWKNEVPIHADEVEPGRYVRVRFCLASATQIHFAASQYVARRVYIAAPYAPLH